MEKVRYLRDPFFLAAVLALSLKAWILLGTEPAARNGAVVTQSAVLVFIFFALIGVAFRSSLRLRRRK